MRTTTRFLSAVVCFIALAVPMLCGAGDARKPTCDISFVDEGAPSQAGPAGHSISFVHEDQPASTSAGLATSGLSAISFIDETTEPAIAKRSKFMHYCDAHKLAKGTDQKFLLAVGKTEAECERLKTVQALPVVAEESIKGVKPGVYELGWNGRHVAIKPVAAPANSNTQAAATGAQWRCDKRGCYLVTP